MPEYVNLLRTDHVVIKLRKKTEVSTGNGSKERVETVRHGTGSNSVQFEFYNKWIELHSAKNFPTQKYMLTQEKIGNEWRNSGRPVTRFEISVKRDGLKAMGINSVDDLFGNEWAIINLLTHDWIRISKEPKIKGKEYKQQNHPLWDRIRNALYQHFNGKNFDDIAEWKNPESVACDPEALEKQALGCLSKAVAARNGEQETAQDSMKAAVHVLNRYKEILHCKINTTARHTENKTGIKLGQSSCEPSWHDVELDRFREFHRRRMQEVSEQIQELERELRGLPFDVDDKAELDYMEGIGKRKIAAMFQESS